MRGLVASASRSPKRRLPPSSADWPSLFDSVLALAAGRSYHYAQQRRELNAWETVPVH